MYFGIDRYYSSGIFLQYGKLKFSQEDSLGKGKYISKHWELGQEINTPNFRSTTNLAKIDYPYNGWLFLAFKKQVFKQLNFGYGWGIQLGTTGADASKAKFLQNTYHRYVLNLDPLAWSYVIPQAYHFNFDTSLYWGRKLKGKLKWVHENTLRAGTVRTAFQTRFGFQWGSFSGLPFFGQRMEEVNHGIAFFTGTALELNLHDYSLSGSLFQSNTPFSIEAALLRNRLQAGFLFYQAPYFLRVIFNYSSPYTNTQLVKYHPYLNISFRRVF